MIKMSSHVKMAPVSSSNIQEIGYDQQTSTMFIKFKSGNTYGYPRVSPAMHQELMRADSVGKHFNAMGIKDRGQIAETN